MPGGSPRPPQPEPLNVPLRGVWTETGTGARGGQPETGSGSVGRCRGRSLGGWLRAVRCRLRAGPASRGMFGLSARGRTRCVAGSPGAPVGAQGGPRAFPVTGSGVPASLRP